MTNTDTDTVNGLREALAKYHAAQKAWDSYRWKEGDPNGIASDLFAAKNSAENDFQMLAIDNVIPLLDRLERAESENRVLRDFVQSLANYKGITAHNDFYDGVDYAREKIAEQAQQALATAAAGGDAEAAETE